MFSPLDADIRAAPGIGLIAAAPWGIPAALFLAGTTQHAWLALPGLACVGACIAAFLRQGLRRGPGAPSRLEVRQNRLWLCTDDGNRRQVRVAPESRIAHRWLWLRLDDERHNHTLLLSDRPGFRNTDPTSLRRLTVWLRYSQPGGDDSQRPAFR
mgnify:FL=1